MIGRAARGLFQIAAVTVTVFVLASLVTFALRDISGLNPAFELLGDQATPQAIAAMEREWGLDRPFVVQYLDWLGAALRGDFGRSWFNEAEISRLMQQRAPVTLSVAALALLIGILGGAVLGILGGVTAGRWPDRAITLVLSAASTVPAFVFGIVLISVFAVTIPLFPAAGYLPLAYGVKPWLLSITLPAIALSLDTVADLARQLRSAIVATYDRNFVLGARACGYGEVRIFLRHVLPNSLDAALAVLGLKFPALLGGAVVTETIFNMNGYGKFAAEAALRGDVPAVQGVLVLAIVLVLVFSTLVNLLLLRLNPAARRGH